MIEPATLLPPFRQRGGKPVAFDRGFRPADIFQDNWRIGAGDQRAFENQRAEQARIVCRQQQADSEARTTD